MCKLERAQAEVPEKTTSSNRKGRDPYVRPSLETPVEKNLKKIATKGVVALFAP